MFNIALVVFRECLEIALLLSIIMSITKPIVASRIYIAAGVLCGIIAALVLVFFSRAISALFNELGDEMFSAGVMLFTAALISWSIIWIQSYVIKIKQDFNNLSIRIQDGKANCIMLMLLVATTILREGGEIIVLVFSISLVETIDNNDYMQGLIIGAMSGFALGVTIYLGLIKLVNQQYIFKISSILLMFVAAGLTAKAAGILTSSSIITILSDQLWDSSWLVSDRSVCGKLLNIVIGYIAKPNGLQITFYVLTISLINILLRIKSKYTSCD